MKGRAWTHILAIGILLTALVGKSFAVDVAPAWTPRELYGLKLYVDPHNTNNVWKEALTAINHATANGDRAAFVDDQSPGAHRLFPPTQSDSHGPLLGGDGTRNTFLDFVPNNFFKVENSLHAFRFFHNEKVFTIAFYLKVDADSTTYQIFDSNNGSTANAGINITRTSGNKLRCWVSYASGGNTSFDITSTPNMNVASGWQFIVIQSDGATASLKIGANSADTQAVGAGAALGTASFADLWIGLSQGSTNGLNGQIDQLLITSTYLDAATLTKIQNYNPTRGAFPVERVYANSSQRWLSPDQVSNLQAWYDFGDRDYVYTDTAKTTKVSADAQEIRLAANKGDDVLKRDLTAGGAAGTYPLWKVGIKNGRAIGRWDGSNDNMTRTTNLTAAGAQWTQFIVVKNDDTTNGSHVCSGTNYIVAVGSAYTGGPPVSYFTTHTDGADAVPASDLPNGGEGFNILEVTRHGNQISSWGNGADTETTTNDERFECNTIGENFSVLTNWDLDGDVCEWLIYNTNLTASTRSRIRYYLQLKWGIANTTLPANLTAQRRDPHAYTLPLAVKSPPSNFDLLFGTKPWNTELAPLSAN